MTIQIEKPNCPKCKTNKKVRLSGFRYNASGKKQRFRCWSCMLYFLTEYDEIKPREPRIISKINCPNCGSNEHVIRNGHDKYGRQNWQCLICLKQWLDEKIRISKKIEPIPILPFSDFTLELKQLSKKPITLDSLEGIPCFSSECISKNHCDPSNCEKLEKWCLDVQETR